MNIQPLGFVDTSVFAGMYFVKHKESASNGILWLRGNPTDPIADPVDLPILKGWKSARAILSRIRTGAAPFFDGVTPELGRVWIETLPPQSATPWTIEEDDYALAHVRLRVCIAPAPEAFTLSGAQSATLAVGIVNRVEHRLLSSEVNHSAFPRTHLVVDVRRPEPADES